MTTDEAAATGEMRYRLAIERGNASMRIPGEVDAARQNFLDALAQEVEEETGLTQEQQVEVSTA